MRNRQLIYTFITILLVALLSFAAIRQRALQDIVNEGLIQPIAYAIWLVRLILGTFEQAVLWGITMFFIGLGIMYVLLHAWPQDRRRFFRPPVPRDMPPRSQGRIDYWRYRIRALRGQGWDSNFAMHEFRSLTLGVERLSDGASSGSQSQIPTKIGQFFLSPEQVAQATLPVRQNGIKARLQRLAARIQTHQAAVDQPLRQLCTTLEERMEMDHEPHD